MTEKFKLEIAVDDDGTITLNSDGVCHHIYLLGILESVKYNILTAAMDMEATLNKGEEKNVE